MSYAILMATMSMASFSFLFPFSRQSVLSALLVVFVIAVSPTAFTTALYSGARIDAYAGGVSERSERTGRRVGVCRGGSSRSDIACDGARVLRLGGAGGGAGSRLRLFNTPFCQVLHTDP